MTRRWTKITQDNVDYLYELRDAGNPIMIATKVEGIGMTYGTPDSYSATLGTMAKMDCYYYYVLPILIK